MEFKAKISEVKSGSLLKADGGFTCINQNSVLKVHEADDGLYVKCALGRHYLSGQIDTEHYIGFILTNKE